MFQTQYFRLYLPNEFQLHLVAVHRSNGGHTCTVWNTLTSLNLWAIATMHWHIVYPCHHSKTHLLFSLAFGCVVTSCLDTRSQQSFLKIRCIEANQATNLLKHCNARQESNKVIVCICYENVWHVPVLSVSMAWSELRSCLKDMFPNRSTAETTLWIPVRSSTNIMIKINIQLLIQHKCSK